MTDQGLLIQNVDVTDNAVYKCQAKSQVSEVSASASLYVDGKTKIRSLKLNLHLNCLANFLATHPHCNRGVYSSLPFLHNSLRLLERAGVTKY